MYKNTRWAFVGLAVLTALCIWGTYKIGDARTQNGKTFWPLGIDLQGGTELTYSLDLSRIERNRQSVAEEVKDVISKRLNAFGLKEISIATQGQDQLVIQLPGKDPESVADLKFQIEKSGNLMFRLVATGEQYSNAAALTQYDNEERNWLEAERAWVAQKIANPAYNEQRPEPPQLIVRTEYEKVNDEKGKSQFRPKKNQFGADLRHPLWNKHEFNPATNMWEPKDMVSGRYIGQVAPTIDENTLSPAVSFQLKGEGATQFADLTGNNIGQPLAIVLDDDVMEVANIKDKISGTCQLSGRFKDEDVKNIITVLRGGSLPTKPTLISESTVGSVLGQDSINSGLKAILFGLAGVMGFMAIYYLLGGMIANLALVMNLLLILAFVMVFNQTLTLPGIAGMLLTLAMAVDANILIFERYREERAKGKNLAQALSAGYDRAFWVIFDSNLTTIISAYVLFYMGTGPVKGFAITLISGLFASFFTSVYVTRIIVSMLVNVGLLKDMKMLQVFATPRIPFTRYQKQFVWGSVALFVVTWIFVLWRGKDNYGIDFSGGARVTMNLNQPVRMEMLRQKLAEIERVSPDLFRDYSVQTLRAIEPGLSSSYALLTRAGVSSAPSKVANAQEPKAAEAPPAAAPGAPAPAIPQPAPVVPAEKPATLPQPATPATPSTATTAPPAGATVGGDESKAVLEPAQQVRLALEKMLEKEGWLLPPPFPTAKWEPSGAGEALTIEVNVLSISTELTDDALKTNINAWLNRRPLFSTDAREPNAAYTGMSIASVQIVSKPLDTDRTKVTRYAVRTNPYKPPLETARPDDKVPTKSQVEDVIRDYFRKGAPGQLEIAEPFPQVSTVGPKVASSLQADALVAVFIAFLGITFYLALRFEFFYGVAGVIALFHDCLLSIGIMAVTDMAFPTSFPVKFNLNELAAILTIIGFSINDTIVVFDRVRENATLLARHKLKLEDLVDISVNQTLSRTLWTSLTVFIANIILVGFGGESVRGFAYLFAVGTVFGTYSSVFVAAPIAIWLHNRSLARKAQLEAQPA